MFDIVLQPVGATFDISMSPIPLMNTALVGTTGQNQFILSQNSTIGSFIQLNLS